MEIEQTTVSLSSIDCRDRTFIITAGRDAAGLVASIKTIGLIQPPLLARAGDGKRYKIVCGYRRIQALEMLGRSEFPAGIVDPAAEPAELLSVALFENLSHRQFNAVEKAEAVSRLRERFPDETVLETWMPVLELHPTMRSLADMQALAGVEDNVKQALLNGGITEKTALRLARLDRPARQALLKVLEQGRLSASKQAEVIENTLDIGLREKLSSAAVLSSDEILEILSSEQLNPVQKGDALRQHLRQWRYPRLSRRKKKFDVCKKELKLGKNVELIPPPYFEGDTYELRITFDSPQSLKKACRLGGQLADLDSLQNLLEETS